MSERSWYDRAAVIPGRSNTRSKSPGKLWPVGTGPYFATGADGAHIHADDDRWYLDMQCALGAISIGYGRVAVRPNTVCSLPYVDEILAAEVVLEHVAPWASQVRFTKTGSEATHGALMVARRATGRWSYHRLRDSYHGWHEEWQLDAPDARWFKVGDVPSTLSSAAAIIIEPPRWETFYSDWLKKVVIAAHDAGALVIFDEMIYGGRWMLGGVVEYFGVVPDLACYGKALGNGAPISMIVGREALADHGEAISGTFSGDAGGCRSLINTIERYVHDDVVQWMWERGTQLQDGLAREIENSDIRATVEGAPVHQRIAFENESLEPLFSEQMISRGIIWAPYSTNLMLAHSERDIEMVIDAAGESLRALEGVQE